MRPLNILIVEDNAAIGGLLAELLADMGHLICDIASTEAAAVAAALRCKPDLMVVDVRLGSGSGIAAVDTIARSQFTPHLFMSGGSTDGATAGAVLLQKPFRVTELAAAIERTVGAAATAVVDPVP